MSYYAPFQRPMGYYNPSIPQEMPQYQQPVQQMSIPPTQIQSGNDMMIWVLSEVEAQSYPVALNNSVTLWDKNKDTVYIKSVNAQGVPSMRILDYTERIAENVQKTHDKHVCECGKDFVKLDVFERLQSDFEALRDELQELKAKPKAKITKTAKTEDENDG